MDFGGVGTCHFGVANAGDNQFHAECLLRQQVAEP